MTHKSKRLFLYAKGTTLGLLALAACSKNNDGPTSGPVKQKTEKAVKDLKSQHVATTDLNKAVQSAKKATQTRAGGKTLDDKIAEQQIVIDQNMSIYQTIYGALTTGENTIPGFDYAAQKQADVMGYNMEDIRHRVMVHLVTTGEILENNVPTIPVASLNQTQLSNLDKFRVAAVNLRVALEHMDRMTGGVERAQEQLDMLESHIYRLSMEVVGILESATGTKVATTTRDGTALSTDQILRNAESLMSGLTEETISPFGKQINNLTGEIELVQTGLDEVLTFWSDLESELTRGPKVAQNASAQKKLARDFMAARAPFGLVQHNVKGVRVRA